MGENKMPKQIHIFEDRYYLFEVSDERLRIVDTPIEKARAYAKKKAESKGIDFEKTFPDFDKHYKMVQQKFSKGWTKREDMPVINPDDIAEFKMSLEKGLLDVFKPHHLPDPFPQFLSGEKTKQFLSAGMKDGVIEDDKVKVFQKKVSVEDLKPIQKEVYMDKSWDNIVNFGPDNSRKFLEKGGTMIVSKDLYIIDGHHRLSQAIMLDPKLKFNVIVVDLNIDILLKLALAYGDAIGNKRNK